MSIKKHLQITLLLLTFFINAQTLKTKQTLISIIQERNITLNGGANASFGGKSRTLIPLVLPANTVSWYYSFTTSPGVNGLENLKLFAQLSSLAYNPLGITESTINKIQVPSGSSGLDVYLLDQKNSDLFVNKVDQNGGTFKYYREGLVTNTNQAIVPIYNSLQGNYYLGLRNPSTFTGIHIRIEVVALVKEFEQQTETQSEAMTIGNLGWKAFERGDYDKCLNLSNQALKLDDSLGYVYFNIALCNLIKGENNIAISEYIKAITMTKKTSIPRQTFQGAIDDLNNYMNKFPSKTDAEDILDLLNQEIGKY
jgi:tetratricopeptide (TPR) repeat protein